GLGDPSLLQGLHGAPGQNPAENWEARLKQVREDMASLRLAEAIARLNDLVIDVGLLRGSLVDAYLPLVLGTLGERYFQSGLHERALDPTRQALERVRNSNDDE